MSPREVDQDALWLVQGELTPRDRAIVNRCADLAALADSGTPALGAGEARTAPRAPLVPAGRTPAGTSTRRCAALPEMTEAQLLDNVRKLSLLTGWLFYHTYDSRRSDAGWPDTVMLNVRQRRILFVELKARKGQLRPMQVVWLQALAEVGMETAVWRPQQWLDGTIERALKGERLDGAP